MSQVPKPMYTLRKVLLPAIFVSALFYVTLFRNVPPISKYYGQAMGTTWSAVVRAPNSSEIQQGIQATLDQVNIQMSTYQPDSEVSRFNRHDTTAFEISSATRQVIAMGLDIHAKSTKAFDITIGPLVNAWGFGFPPSPKNPTDDELIDYQNFVGSQYLTLGDSSIQKSDPRTQIDLSAIAKGFAVDQVATYLTSKGLDHFLIEVGGEIYAHGEKEDGPWIVAIEQPKKDQGTIQISFPLQNQALATSGDYRNYQERDGKRYSHTIDPRTRTPIAHNIASISVITDTVMAADAWATALNVVGEEEAFRLAEEYDLAIYMLIREEDEQFRARSNAAFAEILQSKESK